MKRSSCSGAVMRFLAAAMCLLCEAVAQSGMWEQLRAVLHHPQWRSLVSGPLCPATPTLMPPCLHAITQRRIAARRASDRQVYVGGAAFAAPCRGCGFCAKHQQRVAFEHAL